MARFDISQEFADVQLGDKRLNHRVQAIAERMATDPSRSSPDAFESEADLEAAYRLMNNARVSYESLLAPHVAQSWKRSQEGGGQVLVLHDSSHLTPATDWLAEGVL